MGCLVVALALFSPRVALVLVWFFTGLVDRAFTLLPVPVLGLVFLPLTTLMYVLAYSPAEGVSDLGWLLVALGLLSDLGSYGGGAWGSRH